MWPSEDMSKVVNGKRYVVGKAKLLAHNCYWDGHNYERQGRNTFLYKTARGRYFAVYLTMWQGESDNIVPLSKGEAMEEYEYLREREVEFDEAFDEKVEEA